MPDTEHRPPPAALAAGTRPDGPSLERAPLALAFRWAVRLVAGPRDRALREAELLNTISAAAAGEADLDDILSRTLRHLHRLVDFTGGSIALVEGDELFVAAARGPFADLAMTQRLPRGRGRSWQVVETGQPFMSNDLQADGLSPLSARDGRTVRSYLAVPLLWRGRAFGLLQVDSVHMGEFTAADLVLLQKVATVLAGPIQLARQYGDEVRARDLLEAEVASRTQELREANERLAGALEALQRTQQQVVQQERLRAMGQMASGIAHDLNNALAPVLGYAELLLVHPDRAADADTRRQFLELIRTGAADAASVVARLREFYRPSSAADAFGPVDLHRLVEQTASLTRPKWHDQALARGARITLDTALSPVSAVQGDESSLREALTNLIFNAVDAMPTGGTLTLRTSAGGDHVWLEVLDTGVGMTEEVRARCLEPFFTTKGEHGTGLGLALVHGIVQRHGGTVEIDSAPGRGTTIALRLPAHVASAAGAVAGGRPARSRMLRVLVVDDDDAVRRVTAHYLLGDGHQVDEAASGEVALERFRAGRFDLVLTDKAMPGMSGDQLAAAIKALSPSTPVVMITGFAELTVDEGGLSPHVDLLLPKPLRLVTLRETLLTIAPPVPTVTAAP